MKVAVSFSLFLFLFFPIATYSATKPAKVILLRGKVTSTEPSGQQIKVEKGSLINQGSTIETQKGSVVKLIFSDKSLVTIGPKSKMLIKQIKAGEAGVLSLLKGKIRSKVAKDLLREKKQPDKKSTLFVKTASAAMGVRGTDFSTGFDPKTGATSLDVISGRVSMVNISEFKGIDLNTKSMDQLLNSPDSVKVSQGFRSEVSSATAPPTPPQKIPESELKEFKQNDVFVGKPVEPVEVQEKGAQKAEGSPEENPDEKGEENPGENSEEGPDKGSPEENKDEAPPEEGPKSSGDILPPGVPMDMFVNESPELQEFDEGFQEGPPPENPDFVEGNYSTLNPDLPPPEYEEVPEEFEEIVDDVAENVDDQIDDNFDENSGQTSSRVIFNFN